MKRSLLVAILCAGCTTYREIPIDDIHQAIPTRQVVLQSREIALRDSSYLEWRERIKVRNSMLDPSIRNIILATH